LFIFVQERAGRPDVVGHAGHDAMEFSQRFTEVDTIRPDGELARLGLRRDVEHGLRHLAQLDLGWVVERVLFGRESLRTRKLEDMDAVERPALRSGDSPQLNRGLRQRDIETRFAETSSFEEELERERRLASAWIAFDQGSLWAGRPPPRS
jgi:hypothetical protein